MWELFQKGGEIMYPLLGASVFAVAVIIERLIVLYRTHLPSRAELAQIRQAAGPDGDPERVAKLLKEANSPVHAVMRAVWNTIGDEHAREKAAGVAGDRVLRRLNRRLPWLAILGSLVPLMGLLGTVVGMIRVFSRVSAAGDVSDIGLLAGGIWEALLTTATGLSIAIPILLAYYLLQGRVDRVAFEMRRWGEELMAAMRASEQPARGASEGTR